MNQSITNLYPKRNNEIYSIFSFTCAYIELMKTERTQTHDNATEANKLR